VTLGALSGIVGTDDVSVAAGYTATFNNANVGTNKPVTLSTLTLTGAAAANYTVTTPTGLTANITALSITGAFTAANKIYDGTNAATVLTRTLSGKLPGDSVYLTGGVATFADKHVGTGKTVTLTGASLTGSAALNYELSSVGTTTANITQRTLTLTALTNTKVFNGDTSAVAVPSISGLQVYDTVTGLTETYDTPNVGTGKTLAVATYTVNDGNSGNNYQVVPVPNNTGVITIATPGVTVVVTPAPPASLQYSDQVTLAAVVTGPTTPTGTVQFFIGGIAVGTLQPLAGGSAQVTVQQLVAGPRAQPIPVTAVYTSNTPNYASSTGSAGLQVTREDARADYSGLTFFNTSSVSSGTVNVILSATIRDITAVIGDPQYDAYSGDIRKARVKFVNRDAANSVFANCGNLTPVLVDPADLKTGTVSCTTTLSIGSADSDEFTVGIVIGDTTEVSWYARDSATDNTLVTVSKPLTGFITGGGYLVNAASAGQYAGTNGVKANFGFNVKNKSAKTLQGHVNVIIRRLEGAVWKTYQIKTNAIDSLAQQVSSPTLGAAQFVSKANLADITDPYNPIALGGNLALQMTISDRGEPGTADSLAFTLWDGSTLLYSSRWDGVKTIEQVLGGGNLQVR